MTVRPNAKVNQIERDRPVKHHLEFGLVRGSASLPAEFAPYSMNILVRNLNVLEQRSVDHRKIRSRVIRRHATFIAPKKVNFVPR